MPEYTTKQSLSGEWMVYQDGIPIEVCANEADAQAYIDELVEADEQNED